MGSVKKNLSIQDEKSKSFSDKFIYMKVKLVPNEGADGVVMFKEILLKSLRERFGEMGRSLPIDVLKYNQTSNEAILRCRGSVFNRIICSILFCCEYRSVTYHVKILKVSYSTLGLTCDSRTYNHSSSNKPETTEESRKRKHE